MVPGAEQDTVSRMNGLQALVWFFVCLFASGYNLLSRVN